VANVPVSVVRERTEFRDALGRLVTESVKDFTRSYVRTKFSSLSDFLNRWSKAEQKQAVLRELEQHGLLRGDDALGAFVMINDRDAKPSNDYLDALLAYRIRPFTWSQREQAAVEFGAN